MSRKNDIRRLEIQAILQEKQDVKVEYLAEALNVSLETIRADLTFLEDRGFLYRYHGGAKIRDSIIDIPMDIRTKERVHDKRKIAEKTLEQIKDDDVVYLDPSSTALYLGKLLKLKRNLTIVTNSLELVNTLQDTKHRLIIIGGDYSVSGKRTIGDFALQVLNSIYFDLCVLGMDGCMNLDGPANIDSDELAINQSVMKKSKRKILVSDASKFQKTAYFQYAAFDQFDVFVTTKLKVEDKKRVNIRKIIEI
ncbi:DeoR/GlpR family DNA-binding transcription regulator [Breznakia pachnodae]|uniref:DeoR/GlpR family transcriptional regulator of sugar metabolism n=1 Tax=Breznakia pachnodae TaxID=265178 RepID=A0ABU0E3Z8_9FIRM|nr:DeoR/GlpR family DNA-binding transcription regulator [Breznakia pachnodae]MDQ0361459.1 DeoR/GlpR family transcriptional regulator of sugar metabolism [Breznakia pachnodae]